MKLMICGKGGSGKSTVTALLAKALEERGKNVLVVDADESNIGLYKMIGTDLPKPMMDALGGKKGFQARKKAAGAGLGAPPPMFPAGLTLDSLKQNSLLKDCLAVSGQMQILSIGKIHHFGEGCACPMGNLFRLFLPALSLGEKDLVLVDTAAGLEHFGRRLDGLCDHVLSVVAPSFESITLAVRMAELAKEAGLDLSVILNQIDEATLTDIETELADLTILGRIPPVHDLFTSTLKGQPLNISQEKMDPICQAIENL